MGVGLDALHPLQPPQPTLHSAGSPALPARQMHPHPATAYMYYAKSLFRCGGYSHLLPPSVPDSHGPANNLPIRQDVSPLSLPYMINMLAGEFSPFEGSCVPGSPRLAGAIRDTSWNYLDFPSDVPEGPVPWLSSGVSWIP